jgi:hypothetical protein
MKVLSFDGERFFNLFQNLIGDRLYFNDGIPYLVAEIFNNQCELVSADSGQRVALTGSCL